MPYTPEHVFTEFEDRLADKNKIIDELRARIGVLETALRRIGTAVDMHGHACDSPKHSTMLVEISAALSPQPAKTEDV